MVNKLAEIKHAINRLKTAKDYNEYTLIYDEEKKRLLELEIDYLDFVDAVREAGLKVVVTRNFSN